MFEHFRSLALRLNNEHPNCLKVIHSDNETEFINASFDEFYLEHEIDQQYSCARFCTLLPLSFTLVTSILSLTLGLLDANALF
jgi:hypothetical protein